MALEKVVTYDYEIRTEYKHIQERAKISIAEDGKEISNSYKRRVLTPDMDVSSESDEIKGMASTLWTDEVKAAWCLHDNGHPIGDPSTDWELAQLQRYCDNNSVDYEDDDTKAELVEKIEAE